MREFELNLRLFDGEGAAPAGGGTGSVTGVATGNVANPATAGTADATPTGDSRPSFKDLIKGDYKEEADEYIQNIVRSRVRDSKRDKDLLSRQGDILGIVAAKYGLDSNDLDLDALREKVSEDDSYFEDRAMEEGLTVDQYRRLHDAEQKAQSYEAQVAQQRREAEVQQQVAQWQEQAEQVKQVFPSFDLQSELQNETFRKLLSQGVNMQSAYVAMHDAEILQGAMQYTAQEVRKATANDIAARGGRPRENASSHRAAATVRTDVSKLTKADREALSRRAMSGEIINLS